MVMEMTNAIDEYLPMDILHKRDQIFRIDKWISARTQMKFLEIITIPWLFQSDVIRSSFKTRKIQIETTSSI